MVWQVLDDVAEGRILGFYLQYEQFGCRICLAAVGEAVKLLT